MAQYVNGSAAVQLGQEEFEREELQQPGRRLTVLPGSRPQHREQTQTQTLLAPIAITALKCVGALAATVAAAAVVRTLLIASAFGFSASNTDLRAQLEDARSAGSELEVQQSVFGNPDRITSLATDVYGMVPVEDVTVIDVSVPVAADLAGAGGATTA